MPHRSPEKRIAEIVITGGPCAGKSTILQALPDRLAAPNRRIIVVPEVPTHIINAGFTDIAYIRANQPDLYYQFQLAVSSFQLQQRQLFNRLATHTEEPEVILLHDRAELDIDAYLDPESCTRVFAALGMSRSQIISSYHLIVHLVTAALGAPEFYNFDNPARYESPAQAIVTDAITQTSWSSHPNFHRIGNPEVSVGVDGLALKTAQTAEVIHQFLLEFFV